MTDKEKLIEGEPPDAQVLAALNAYAPWSAERRLADWGEGSVEPMRAALRAAFAVPEQQIGLPGNPGVAYDDIGM